MDDGNTTDLPYPVAQSRDTAAEAELRMIRAYRSMPPWEKARRVSELCLTASLLALVGIRARHGECSDEEARLRLAALRLDPAIMLRLFGWDPKAKGY